MNGREDLTAEYFYARWKQYHRRHIQEMKAFVNEEEVFHLDLRALYKDFDMHRDPDEDICVMLNTLGRRTAFPEVKGVLDALRSRYTICIASTTDTAPLLSDLQRNGLRVERVFTSETLRLYKPDPRFYRAILSELNVGVEEALFVGDSLTDDVLGPQHVGLRTCWVNRRGETAEKAAPDFEVSCLTDVIAVADSIDRVI